MEGNRFTIVLTTEEGEQLKELAAKHGCFWAGRPSPTDLIRRIATTEIKLQDSYLEG